MIPFNNRFHGHSSLNFVFRNGKAIHSRLFIIKTISNPNRKKSRAAVIISKKILKGAVKRNRVRRQVYSYLSEFIKKLDGVYDIAIIVTAGELFTLPHQEIFNQLDQLFSQIDIKTVK